MGLRLGFQSGILCFQVNKFVADIAQMSLGRRCKCTYNFFIMITSHIPQKVSQQDSNYDFKKISCANECCQKMKGCLACLQKKSMLMLDMRKCIKDGIC